jgi:hypothetical protein
MDTMEILNQSNPQETSHHGAVLPASRQHKAGTRFANRHAG